MPRDKTRAAFHSISVLSVDSSFSISSFVFFFSLLLLLLLLLLPLLLLLFLLLLPFLIPLSSSSSSSLSSSSSFSSFAVVFFFSFFFLCPTILGSPVPPSPVDGCEEAILLFVDCLASQQHASVSQERICSDNFTCCHTETAVADQTFYLTQSQYTDTGPTSPSADPIPSGAWQGGHWSVNF